MAIKGKKCRDERIVDVSLTEDGLDLREKAVSGAIPYERMRLPVT